MTAALKLHRPPPRKKQKMSFAPRHLKYLSVLAHSKTGLTDDELRGKVPGMDFRDACLRRGELVRLGLVRDSGTTRKSSRGRTSTVWVVTPEGKKTTQKLCKEKSR